MELRGRRVVLRPVVPADVDDLSRILATPEVARWWPFYDRARVEREYITAPDPDQSAYTIFVDGRVVGLIQAYEESEPEFRHAAIDVSLDPASHAQGLGPESLRVLARHLIEVGGHHRLTIDPAAANEFAIRAYEKVGFRRVGILRRYQSFPDGTWQDGLLMELLAEELRD
ncbi:MAG TPA: GNAT family protein [Candidatus Limnocylindrales bacterium]|jgi:aminoglycoside 6'-N-acetyltransferase|nr:GNAT family protein [Candidatus Limnocylindrales bacterium]